MSLEPGTSLGPYEILAPLGAGGMGEVYRARDTRLGREVAIKVLPGAISSDAQRLLRFEQEARAASALNHSSIVTIHDVGRDGETAFIAMELVSGQTLRDALASGPPPLKRMLQIVTQVAEGLAAAHARGIVHRDLKPENVMVTKDGAVKILDFGLAKLTPSGVDAASALETTPKMTVEGTVLGTVGYMSPEQASGRPTDFRSDQFSFGAILYELLTGRRAFARTTAAETMAAIIRDEPPPLDTSSPAPAPLRWTLERCLAKEPAERFESTRDLARDLANVRDHISETGTQASATTPASERARPTLGEPATPAPPRRRAVRVAAVLPAALAALIAGAGVLWLRPARAPQVARLVRFTLPPPEGGTFSTSVETTTIAVSPDGSRIAFVAATVPRPGPTPAGVNAAGTGPAVFIRELGALESRRLDATDGAASVFWAPDGSGLGFFTPTKLKRVDVASGNAVTICDLPIGSGRSGTWSESGEILFASIQGTTIWRVPASGGKPEPTLEADASKSETREIWPWFLPDGKRFLHFARLRDGTGRLMLGEAGKPSRVIAPIESAAQYVDPGYLVYADEGQLLARRFDAGTGAVSGEPFAIADHVSFFRATAQAAFGASRSGVIAYQSRESVSRLALVDGAGREIGILGSRASFFSMSVGRGGRRILYDRLAGVGALDVWSFDLDRGIETRLTTTPEVEVSPIELADGKSLVISVNLNGQPQLHRLDTTSGRMEILAPGEGTFQLAEDLSPDGSTLLYTERTSQSPWDLWTLPLSPPGKPVPFLRAPFDKWSPRFSRDGRFVAFVSDESGGEEAYITPYPGPGERTRVSTNGARLVRFSGDGTQLFYLSPDRKLMSVSVRTDPSLVIGAPRELFQLTGRPWESFDVLKDGRFIAIVPEVIAGEQPLTVVVGWTPGR